MRDEIVDHLWPMITYDLPLSHDSRLESILILRPLSRPNISTQTPPYLSPFHTSLDSNLHPRSHLLYLPPILPYAQFTKFSTFRLPKRPLHGRNVLGFLDPCQKSLHEKPEDFGCLKAYFAAGTMLSRMVPI